MAGFFDPDPYGGIAPWADAAMQLGAGLMAGGAPGGGGLAGLGPAFAGIAQGGRARAANRRAAQADERAEKLLALQEDKFKSEQNRQLREDQQNYRTAMMMGIPAEVLGPMPGTLEATQATGETVPIPPEGPVSYSPSTDIMYEPGGLMGPERAEQGGMMGEGMFANLPPEAQAGVAGLIMQGKPGEALRLAESMKGPRPTKLQQQIDAARAMGMSEEDINTMLANSLQYQPTVDPFTGQRTVLDLLNPQGAVPPGPVAQGAPTPAPAGGPVAGMEAPPGGYAQGTGGSGFFANFANTITDALGLPLAAPEAKQAATDLETLNTRTMLELSAGIPGRPSNLTREVLQDLGPKPNNLLQGDASQKVRIDATLKMLDSQSEQWQRVADDQSVPVAQRKAAQDKVNNISELRKAYEYVAENFYAPTPYADLSKKDLLAIAINPPKDIDWDLYRRELLKRRGKEGAQETGGFMGGS